MTHIVDRTLKKHPANRYRVAVELAGDLNVVYQEIKTNAREVSGKHELSKLRLLLFFVGFDDSEIMEVPANGVWKDYRAGEETLVEGSRNDVFYTPVSGQASVNRGGKEIDFNQSGESFGEIGFVLEHPSTARTFAKDSVRVIEVIANHVERASVNCQLRFQKMFLRSMARRLSTAMARMSPPGTSRPASAYHRGSWVLTDI